MAEAFQRVRRPADDRVRRVVSIEPLPPFRDIYKGVDIDTREELTFRASHVLRPLPSVISGASYDRQRGMWRTDTGSACRYVGLKWEPPSNESAARELARVEERIAALDAEIIRLSRA